MEINQGIFVLFLKVYPIQLIYVIFCTFLSKWLTKNTMYIFLLFLLLLLLKLQLPP